MDKKIRKVNTKLYLEYLRFKDEILRKTQDEVFESCYKIDVFLNLYQIVVEKAQEMSVEMLLLLENDENILEELYRGWMKTVDDKYGEMDQFVTGKLDTFYRTKAG